MVFDVFKLRILTTRDKGRIAGGGGLTEQMFEHILSHSTPP